MPPVGFMPSKVWNLAGACLYDIAYNSPIKALQGDEK